MTFSHKRRMLLLLLEHLVLFGNDTESLFSLHHILLDLLHVILECLDALLVLLSGCRLDSLCSTALDLLFIY